MLDFLVGAAIIALPAQQQIPLALGTVAFKGIQGLVRLKRESKERKSLKAQESELSIPTDNSSSKLNQVDLVWSQVTCTLKIKDGERVLLDNLHGHAKAGRLLAIIGPSGSGKTTLLSTLAGQLPYNKGIRLEGYITANGDRFPSPKIRSGFVAQEDLFFSQMTVKETLLMTAELRTSGSDEGREEMVNSVIRRMGLSAVTNTAVGDAKTRGLSGGEKKRLSIACELIARPQVIFADEPTSGLDAFAALQAIKALKDLTEDGHTVIASVHQPRSSIFEMFDDLCILAKGQLVYFGEASQALAYFENLGYKCPEHYNPAEFLADLVAVDHSDSKEERDSEQRIQRLVSAWNAAAKEDHMDQTSTREEKGKGLHVHRPACGLPRQVALLLRRSWRQITRDRATAISRASSQLSSAIVFSTIYWRMGRGQASIQDRLGLLQVSAVGTAMSSLIKTLNVFPSERTIVTRERSRAAYPVLPYLLSKLAAELPIGALFPALFGAVVYPATGLNPRLSRFARFLAVLTAESFSAQALGLAVGAVAPSTEAALAIGPAVILVSIVFGGLFVNEKSVPFALQWAPRTSLIKHAFEGACVNEFEGQMFDLDERGHGEGTGNEVLERLAFESDSVKGTLINQGRVCVLYWWAAYCILKSRRPKYQPLLVPAGSQGSKQ